MPKGTQHNWTRDELDLVLAVKGTQAHEDLAQELGLSIQTIYSTRQRVRVSGGVEGFLQRQHEAGTPLKPRLPETIDEQLARLYLINVSGAGRGGGQPQYTVTIPSQLGAVFVEKFGRQIRFEPVEDGIKIAPVPKLPLVPMPTWADGAVDRSESPEQNR